MHISDIVLCGGICLEDGSFFILAGMWLIPVLQLSLAVTAGGEVGAGTVYEGRWVGVEWDWEYNVKVL